MKLLKNIAGMLLIIISTPLFSVPDHTQLAVFANEAIVATYTMDYKNFLPRKREIAKYFSEKGWINYSAALMQSGLPTTIKKNAYSVSAVATLPPVITNIATNKWKAVMPILVNYKNPQYQQKQHLEVTITFSEVPMDQGVRGLSIDSLQSKVTEAACECVNKSA